MAVFGPNEEAAFATDAMLSMQECWPEIRKRVTFHLVYPTEHPADLTTSKGMLQIILQTSETALGITSIKTCLNTLFCISTSATPYRLTV